MIESNLETGENDILKIFLRWGFDYFGFVRAEEGHGVGNPRFLDSHSFEMSCRGIVLLGKVRTA